MAISESAGKMSKRDFLKVAARVAGLMATGGLLSGCIEQPKSPSIPGLIFLSRADKRLLENQVQDIFNQDLFKALSNSLEPTEQDRKTLSWLFDGLETSKSWSGEEFYHSTREFYELNHLKGVPSWLAIYEDGYSGTDYAYEVDLPEGKRRMLAVGKSYRYTRDLYTKGGIVPDIFCLLDSLEGGLDIVYDQYHVYDPNSINISFVPSEAFVPLILLGSIRTEGEGYEAYEHSMAEKFGDIILKRGGMRQVILRTAKGVPVGSNTLILTYDDKDPDAGILTEILDQHGETSLQNFKRFLLESYPYRTYYVGFLLEKSLRNFIKPFFQDLMGKMSKEFDEFTARIPALHNPNLRLPYPLNNWSQKVIDPRMVVITEKGKDGKLGILYSSKLRTLTLPGFQHNSDIVIVFNN